MSNIKYSKEDFNKELYTLHNNSSFNPYLILNISTEYTQAELKEKYKYFALITHPDKGGDPGHFSLVTKSYLYLLKALKEKLPTKQLSDLKLEHNDYINEQENKPLQNINFNGKKFNLNKFNNVFNEYKLDDENTTGYNNFLKQGEIQNEEIDNEDENTIFSDDFNLSIFNKIFNITNSKQNNNYKNKQLVKVEEPKEMCNINGYQLGVSNINDFSKGYSFEKKNTDLDYTDIKVAHTTSKLVDETLVDRKDFKSIDELQQVRSNISYDLSERDRILIEQREIYKQQKEQERINNLNLYDNRNAEQFNKIHKLMLNN